MRLSLITFLVCIATIVPAQGIQKWIGGSEDEGKYGKSDAQILAMGREEWTGWHSEKAGQTTVAMVEGQVVWFNAVTTRNNELLLARNPESRKKLIQLDSLLEKYRIAGLEAGMAHSGGGTMWQIFGASSLADRGDLMLQLLTRTGKPTQLYRVSDVKRHIAAARAAVKERKSEPEIGIDQATGLKKLGEIEALLPKIVSIAATMPRRSSDLILEYCRRKVELVSDF